MHESDLSAVAGVIIVGAGPVGLSLAVELGWRGIPATVIEQSDGSVAFPAGEALFSRTMEHFRRWGISDKTRIDSAPPTDFPHRTVFATSATGHLLAEFNYGVTNRAAGIYEDFTPEGPTFVSRFSLIPLLMQSCRDLPTVRVDLNTRLESFSQDDNGVRVEVRDLLSGQSRTLDAAYLVACDGGKSGIRRTLGIDLNGTFAQGQNFAVHFRAPELLDLIRDHLGGRTVQIHTMSSAKRPYITVVNGADEWRLSVYVEGAVDAADAVTWVQEAVGAPIDVEVLAAQPWSGHCVVADRYRQGRVFLAGDSAHLLWPKGGFGANTGIGDAVDLGWKLAATLEGWGGPGLLDSYEAERRPIAVRNVTEAASNWEADSRLRPSTDLLRTDAAGEAARDAMRAMIQDLRGKEFRTAGVQLGYRYSGSPVIEPDGTPEPEDRSDSYVPSTWPGCRAPHVWLPDGNSMLDHFGHGFVLVMTGPAEDEPFMAAALRRGIPLRTLRIEDPTAAERYERRLVLVRPDGHVAWRGDLPPADVDALFDRISGLTDEHAVSPTDVAVASE